MQEVVLQFSADYGFAKGEVMRRAVEEEWTAIQRAPATAS